MSTKSRTFKFLVYTLLLAFTFAMITPVYILVKVSISEPKEVNTDHPTFFLHDATIKHWANILMADKRLTRKLIQV